MFCPKCGNQVPDGAVFCGKCGNKFDGASEANPQHANSASTVNTASNTGVSFAAKASQGKSLANLGIFAAIAMIVAVIVTLLPWLELPSWVSSATNVVSNIASSTGQSSNSLSFENQYNAWGLIGFVDTYNNYASVASSSGFSEVTPVSGYACFLLCAISLVLTICGAIAAFSKGNVTLIRFASIAMILAVLVFYLFLGFSGSSSSQNKLFEYSATFMPFLCLLLAIAALVISFVKKKA